MSEKREYFDTDSEPDGKGMVINTEGEEESQGVTLDLEGEEASDEKESD